MNIIMYRWNAHQHKHIYETMAQMGHQVTEYKLPISNPEEEPKYVDALQAYLQKHPFDFLFSINYFPVLSEACGHAGIPYVSWTCDSPLIAMHHSSVYNANNYIFVFDKSDYHKFLSLGLKHIYYLPLGASFSQDETVSPEQAMEYSISFVGSLYYKNGYDAILPSLSPYLAGYFDCALEAQLQITGGSLLYQLLTPDICHELESISNYQKAESSFSTLRLLFANTVLGFKAASLGRSRWLNQISKTLLPLRGETIAADDGVHLFTDCDPSEQQMLQEALPLVKLHKSVDYNTELPGLYRKSRINLNFTIPNIQTGLPLRIWDVMGAGAFLLSNEQEEISSLLEPGKDLETFTSTEELQDKILFYLTHEDARQKIVQQGGQTVRQAHTARHRIKELFTILKQEL